MKNSSKDSLTHNKTASVLLPIPVDQPYSYQVPDDMELVSGSVVIVPVKARQVAALVIAIDRGGVKESTESTESGPRQKAVKRDISDKKPPNADIAACFDCPPLRTELLRFMQFVASYNVIPLGLVARMILRPLSALTREKTRDVLYFTGRCVEGLTLASGRVLDIVHEKEYWTRSDLAKRALVAPAVIDRLKKQGVLESVSVPQPAITEIPDPYYQEPDFEGEQNEAILILRQYIKEKKFSVSLLEGVTGSGKTEVYFEAVAAVLQQGRQVLILLPEIALTQQFLDRFQMRFGVFPAQWHSNLTPQRRETIWRQAASGKIHIIAGARSALFLPFLDLGLIIVDEEHDAAYKQEDKLSYHARDMAVVRGKIANIPVILASATPSVETQVNVGRGRYHHLVLSKRFANAALPDLAVLDMRHYAKTSGNFLAPPLIQAIEQRIERGEQALLFLNRRGYAPLTLCRMCGYRFACPHCSSWLVEHRHHKKLLCHYCNHQQSIPKICPECATEDRLVAYGPGVEKIAEEVTRKFPDSKILVLSTDRIASLTQLRHELDMIVKKEVDIIIGTQLIAKGHHFPYLTLVGVIDADFGLSTGDPRAAEKTFQLLSQVTGRAGRSGLKSHGLIQSWQPEHPVIQAILARNDKQFYAREIAERQRYLLPPFGRLAALIVSSVMVHEALSYARKLRQFAPAEPGITLLGPVEAPIARIGGRYRFRLLIQGEPQADIQNFIRTILSKAGPPSGSVQLQIDIDPQSFL